MSLKTWMGLFLQPSGNHSFSRTLGLCYRAASILHWPYSWRSFKCNIWKCHRDDNLYVRAENWDDKSGSTISTQFHLVKHVISPWGAFFTGGIVHYKKIQLSNKAAAMVNSGLLLMAVMGITFPALLHFTHTEVHKGKSELVFSRLSSCIMLIAYASYLYVQPKSQQNLYSPIDVEIVENNDCSDEEEEVPEISKCESIAWLFILTLWVSILSGYLVDAIQGASEAMKDEYVCGFYQCYLASNCWKCC